MTSSLTVPLARGASLTLIACALAPCGRTPVLRRADDATAPMSATVAPRPSAPARSSGIEVAMTL